MKSAKYLDELEGFGLVWDLHVSNLSFSYDILGGC